MPFNGPVIPFAAMVEYHPISAKDLSRLHQFGPKVLPGIFLGYAFSCGVNLEGSHNGRSIHKDLLPHEAVVTHMITCQGRNVRSGCRKLVVVNVHFEPELTLRSLRERLCLITPHWPQYPNANGIIMGDFNICEPEEGMFNVWNQTFTDGDTGKAALFHSLFHRVLEITQPPSLE